MKKLMILGAGSGQLPAIKRAVELGHYVITVDYLPDNIGHKFSHHYVSCSTLDQLGILKAANDIKIDGIITLASDIATSTVSFVGEKLGLQCPSSMTVQLMSNKGKFRAVQRENGLTSPGFAVGANLQEIEDAIISLSHPLVFKPVDTSGSRGISKVITSEYKKYKAAFEHALHYSRSKEVCIEEYMDGLEVGGDGFLKDGRLVSLVITNKYKLNFVPIGHSLPSALSKVDQDRVINILNKHCEAVGYTDGALNFDVIISPEQEAVLEMSPRLGGNGIPEIIQRSTGVDLIELTISNSLGLNVELSSPLQPSKECGSWIYGCASSGRLKSIATNDEIIAKVPNVFIYVNNQTLGQNVPAFDHSGNSLGYILFDIPEGYDYSTIVDRLRSALNLHIE